jgi:hypothetical protein
MLCPWDRTFLSSISFWVDHLTISSDRTSLSVIFVLSNIYINCPIGFRPRPSSVKYSCGILLHRVPAADCLFVIPVILFSGPSVYALCFGVTLSFPSDCTILRLFSCFVRYVRWFTYLPIGLYLLFRKISLFGGSLICPSDCTFSFGKFCSIGSLNCPSDYTFSFDVLLSVSIAYSVVPIGPYLRFLVTLV